MSLRHLLFASLVVFTAGPVSGGAGAQPQAATVDIRDGAYKETMLAWPWLPQNPSVSEKLLYAERVARWAERVQPIKSFDPSKLPATTQAELKIQDALRQLDSIKDTKSQRAEVEYAETVKNPMSIFIRDQVKDYTEEMAVEHLIGETAAKYFSGIGTFYSLIKPIPIAEDDMLWRYTLRKKLSDQSDRYEKKRAANTPPFKFVKFILVITPGSPPRESAPDQDIFARWRPLAGAQPRSPPPAFPSTLNIKPLPTQPFQPLHLPTRATQPSREDMEEQGPSIGRQP